MQARDSLRDQIVSLVLGTDMKQHFGTCGAFGVKVLAPLVVVAAAAETAPPSGALATAEDPLSAGGDDDAAADEDDTSGVHPNENEDEGADDGDDDCCVLRGLQMDDEAQLLTWKVWERGRGGGVSVATCVTYMLCYAGYMCVAGLSHLASLQYTPPPHVPCVTPCNCTADGP